MARKRGFTTFSLSFLDIMSCGFGAVALVFLIIKHETTRIPPPENNVLAEVNMLDEDIRDGEKELVRARNIVAELDQRTAEAQGLSRRIITEYDTVSELVKKLSAPEGENIVLKLEDEIKSLEEEIEKLEEKEQKRGNNFIKITGDGRRQNTNGLRMEGSRILILLDASSSMLADTPAVAIRNKLLPDEVKKKATKWRRAVNIVKWLGTNLPQDNSRFQIYTFNTGYASVIPNSEDSWLELNDASVLEQAIANLNDVVPQSGTSLARVFSSIVGFVSRPDNIFLITDGLPTQGFEAPKKNTVTGAERERLFTEAITALPKGVPINIILLPMKGDPKAADAYWRLAQQSNGTLLSPTADWPGND